MFSPLRRHLPTALLLLTFLLGVLLRTQYTIKTPYDVRGHDTGGHIEYINYIATNWNIPDPHAGFEFYQPPLYYLLAAVPYRLFLSAGWSEHATLVAIEWVSFLLSLITLILFLWTGNALFQKKERAANFLFGAIAAAFPALIFFAARINNDVLYQVTAAAGFLLLLLFWKTKKVGYWYGFSLAVGLGLLTKSNMLLLVPLGFLCMPRMRLKTKAIHALLGAALMVFAGGWFPLLRAVQEEDSKASVIGNYEILTNFVENSPRAYLVFHPIGIVRHPYNDPFDDAERRQYLWEYLFRSGVTGEFNFGDRERFATLLMLISLLLLLPCMAYAAWRWRKRFWTDLPLWLLLPLLLISNAALRFIFPYSSMQDFRYSILLVLPISYFAVLGIEHDSLIMRILRATLILLFTVGSTLFFILLPAQ